VWHSARRDPEEHTGLGWLGRALDDAPPRPGGDALSMLVGPGVPPAAIRGRRAAASALERPEEFALDAGADPRRAVGKDGPGDDLASAKLADRAAVLVFSEFGRTVRENGSAGTDHGTAAPVFLAGAPVKAGVVGEAPSLVDLDPRHGDLRVGLDFRRIYAAIL